VSQPGQHRSEGQWPAGSMLPGGGSPRIGWLHPRRRAVRLAGAIGVMVGVLCIVLGTLALVVELGPRHPGKPQPTAHTAYTGHGNGQPQSIQIPGPGPYEVDWSFNCPSGHTGAIKLGGSRDAATANADLAKGHHGHGSLLDRRTGTDRALYVVSTCHWTVNVHRPSPTASPTPPQSWHKHKHHHWHKKHHRHKNVHQQAQQGQGDD